MSTATMSSKSTKLEVVVDPEFQHLLKPLDPEELGKLEESLKAEGCRDPLYVWKSEGKLLIVDGHNRFEICSVLDLPYKTKQLKFKTREDVCVWIIRNQIGRRNLSVNDRVALAIEYVERSGALEEARKAQSDGGKKGKDAVVDSNIKVGATVPAQGIQTNAPINNVAKIAEIAKVPKTTVEKNKFITKNGNAEEVNRLKAMAKGDSLHKIHTDVKKRIDNLVAEKAMEKKEQLDKEAKEREAKELSGLAGAARAQSKSEAKVAKLVEAAKSPREWQTPAVILKAAKTALGSITLDPASSEAANKRVGAEKFFNKNDNGLKLPWVGNVFLSIPVGKTSRKWQEKIMDDFQEGKVKSAVVIADLRITDSCSQRLLAMSEAICFPKKQIDYKHSHDTEAGYPRLDNVEQAIFFLGNDVSLFEQAFNGIGAVKLSV